MKTNVGEYIYISTYAGSARSSVSLSVITTSVFGKVVGATEKAIQVEAETEKGKKVTAWFPKKALIEEEVEGEYIYRLAKWFNPTDWTNTFLNITQKTSVLSA